MLPVPADPQSRALQQTSMLTDMTDLLAGRLAASSIAMYRRDIAAYQAYCREQNLPELDALSLASWRDHLAAETVMSPNTINRMLSAVKRLVKEAAERRLLSTAIRVEFADVAGVKLKALKSRLKKHARTRITPQEMRAICEAPDTTTLVGLRDRALLATLASSGLRASELTSLTYGQIKRSGRGYYLEIIGKSDIEARKAHLSVEAHAAILAWQNAQPVLSPCIFTSFSTRAATPNVACISEVAVWTIVKRYAAICNLQHIKPHDFRRFVGTQLAAQDIRKAQKALGHASIEVMARHYVLDELEIGLTDHLY